MLGLAASLGLPADAAGSSGSGEAAPKDNGADLLERIDEEIRDGKGSIQEVDGATLEAYDNVLSGAGGGGATYRYKLGPELEGFDLSVLRSTVRLEPHRYEMGELVATSSMPHPKHLRFQCVLEFGNESGLAEVERSHDIYKAMIMDSIGRMTDEELKTTAGKLELKETIIRECNRRLKTARLRQIYFTYFTITPIKTLNNL